ncbi:MAG: futalosine hydrolase [Bacteroidota bacterium]
MKILICAATHFEVDELVREFTPEITLNDRLRRFTFRNHSIDVLITAMGMVPTAYRLAKTFALQRYDFALNLGIAGSFSKNLAIGDVVNVYSDLFSELGAEDGKKFMPIREMELDEAIGYPFVEGKLMNISHTDNAMINQMKKVTGITVNTIHGNEESIAELRRLYRPDVETMEGAAFLYGCLEEGIPCAQIRSISNYVQLRNKDDWDIPTATDSLYNTSVKILNAF